MGGLVENRVHMSSQRIDGVPQDTSNRRWLVPMQFGDLVERLPFVIPPDHDLALPLRQPLNRCPESLKRNHLLVLVDPTLHWIIPGYPDLDALVHLGIQAHLVLLA